MFCTTAVKTVRTLQPQAETSANVDPRKGEEVKEEGEAAEDLEDTCIHRFEWQAVHPESDFGRGPEQSSAGSFCRHW